jgi:2'-5' RNA ligase
MRLFVAVVPPPEVLDVVAALARPAQEGLRWTTPAQWHVTLRFLGRVDDPGPVADALRGVRSTAGEAVLGPATARLGRSGVLHLPVAGLEAVAEEVVSRTAGIGRPPEDRPFVGHLTLARAKGRVDWRALTGQPATARWRVDDVVLMESRLHPHGARYTVIERFPLGG